MRPCLSAALPRLCTRLQPFISIWCGAIGVVHAHAWAVAQKLLECNEIKSFVVNRGAMAARDRFAAAVRAAVQIRRCQSTASRPVRALTASFFRYRRALKQKTFPRINRLCAKRTWWPVVEQWSSDIWEKQKQR